MADATIHLIALSTWWNTALSLPDPHAQQKACRCPDCDSARPIHCGIGVQPSIKTSHLLLVILSLVVDDVEEAELVNTLGGGDDTEPVTELLLLEELLGAAHIISHWPFPCLCLGANAPQAKRTGTSGSGRRTPGEQ